jgi:hypothetical protein
MTLGHCIIERQYPCGFKRQSWVQRSRQTVTVRNEAGVKIGTFRERSRYYQLSGSVGHVSVSVTPSPGFFRLAHEDNIRLEVRATLQLPHWFAHRFTLDIDLLCFGFNIGLSV